MKNQGIKIILSALLLVNSVTIHAATPKFSIIPSADSINAIYLPNNFTETVNYQITNNTTITRTLTMVPIPGISQTLTGDVCANPFTLAPKQSCTLSLIIHGNQVPTSGIMGGPVICKTKAPNDNSPDLFLCSQPSPANELAISISTSPGQHAYVANQLGDSLSYCQVNPVTGLFSQCAITATGLSGIEGVGFNPAGTLFYSANLHSSTITMCTLDQATGALTNCVDAGGTGFDSPDAVAFSPDGSIFYTSNVGGSVTACLVDNAGQLSACINNSSLNFFGASDMALNAGGTIAYVSNRYDSTVSVCQVSGQLLSACNNASGSLFDAPEGITLDPLGTHAYIANAGNGKVILCDIRQDGTGLLTNCAATGGQFAGTGNVAFNDLGSFAYVPNQNPLINEVFRCQVSARDASLSNCLSTKGTGFDGPSGIVIH